MKKTNYKVGETYYDKYGGSLLLVAIDLEREYPLILKKKYGEIRDYTLDGSFFYGENPSLSTSPDRFIAPKSNEEYYVEFSKEAIDRIIKAYGITEPMLTNCTPIKFSKEYDNMIKIEQAIKFLKKEGYTITKQY